MAVSEEQVELLAATGVQFCTLTVRVYVYAFRANGAQPRIGDSAAPWPTRGATRGAVGVSALPAVWRL